MKMGRLKRRKARKGALEEIVCEIAKEAKYGFQEKCVTLHGDPCFDGNGIRQDNKTDLEFLLDLACDWGAILYVTATDEGDNFYFLSERHVMQELEPAVKYYYGRCDVEHRLLSFKANVDVGNIQLPRVLSGMDFETGQRIQPEDQQAEQAEPPEDEYQAENLTEFGKSDKEKGAEVEAMATAAEKIQKQVRDERGAVEHIADPGLRSPEHIKERAKNQFSTRLLGMEGSGTATGNHRLHAQTTVEIADAGRFSGKWFLSKVQHTVDSKGYYTSFECRR